MSKSGTDTGELIEWLATLSLLYKNLHKLLFKVGLRLLQNILSQVHIIDRYIMQADARINSTSIFYVKIQ